MHSNPLPLPQRALVVLLAALAAGGCVDATIEQYQQLDASVQSGEKVVVLGRRHNTAYETETNFVECIGDALASRGELQVVPEKQFVDELYPWFEPRTAPLKTADLPELLANPLVADRVAERDLRYLVWVDGSTSTTDQAGSMTCTISPGGGGCFGFVTWARDSSYEASIWDLQEQRNVGRISSDASGTSYMPAVVLPVPIIARVQAQACGGLADQLTQFFAAG